MKSRMTFYVMSAVLSIIAMTILKLSGCNETAAIIIGALCGSSIGVVIDVIIKDFRQ